MIASSYISGKNFISFGALACLFGEEADDSTNTMVPIQLATLTTAAPSIDKLSECLCKIKHE